MQVLLNDKSIEMELQQIATKLEREKYDGLRLVALYNADQVKSLLAAKAVDKRMRHGKEHKKVTDLLGSVKQFVAKQRRNNRSVSRAESRQSRKSSISQKKAFADKVLSLRRACLDKENRPENVVQRNISPIEVRDEGEPIEVEEML